MSNIYKQVYNEREERNCYIADITPSNFYLYDGSFYLLINLHLTEDMYYKIRHFINASKSDVVGRE